MAVTRGGGYRQPASSAGVESGGGGYRARKRRRREGSATGPRHPVAAVGQPGPPDGGVSLVRGRPGARTPPFRLAARPGVAPYGDPRRSTRQPRTIPGAAAGVAGRVRQPPDALAGV